MYKTLIICLVILLLAITAAWAQGPGAPPATPIDGGLSLLLAAGGIYGYRKLAQRKR